MSGFVFKDHSKELIAQKDELVQQALESMGQLGENYAKNNVTSAGRIDEGTMRGDIAHTIKEDTVYIGTNVEYAIYHELGTGIYAEGGGGRKTPWHYKDRKGKWHTTVGITPIHFLKRAVEDHKEKYIQIVKQTLGAK